jgi:CRP-like cAMP-binding protein
MTFLDKIEILAPLTKEEKNRLSDFCQERPVNKWEVIFDEWDEANAMYILKTGSVGIYKDIDGIKVYLWTVHAEEILGEMAIFNNNWIRTAQAIAMEDTIIITILSFSMHELTKTNPIIMNKIHQIIEERMTQNKILENKIRKK